MEVSRCAQPTATCRAPAAAAHAGLKAPSPSLATLFFEGEGRVGGKTHDLAGLLPVAKAVSSKRRGAVEGGICLERRQMMYAGTRQSEEPAATGDGGKWDPGLSGSKG